MKNNNCKFLLLIFFAFIMMPTIVFAAHSAVGGNTSSYGSCKGYDWCYSGKTGLRFSLYKYKDSGLTYYASSDYSTNGCAYNGKTAHISKDSSGKVAYQNNKSSISWDTNTYYKLKINDGSSNFSCYFGNDCSNFNKTQVEKFFKINGATPDSNAVKNQINSVFGTNISVSDLSYIYITVEPTIYIYNSNGDSFYGTIYEIMNMSKTLNGGKLYGIDEVLYRTFPISITASNPTSNDSNNFVGEKIRIVANANKEQPFSLTSGWDSNANQRKESRAKIVSNDGYGIGVFWLGDYIKTDCKSVCSGKSGNALLNCASNYCGNDPNVTTSLAKEECVNSCGYEKVEPNGCESTSIPSSTRSFCSQESGQTKNTCIEAEASESRFYKIECSEKTTIKYSNDLPTVFQKRMGGFNYYVRTQGERECTLTWDEKYYNYKLAVTINPSNIEAKKTEFDNFGKDSYKGAIYSFEENDTVVLMVDKSSYSLKKTIDETSDVEYTPGGKTKTYSTTNEAMFELPLICYPLDNKASLLPGCNDIKTNPNYYGFYNNSTDSRVNTTTIVKKESSGLNDTNTCYYLNQDNTLDTDVNCYLDIIKGTHDENGNYSDATVSYRVVNRFDKEVECKFDGTTITNCDASKEFKATSTDVKEINVNASIAYTASNGKPITKQCPIKFNLKTGIIPSSNEAKNNCPETYDSSHYDAIRNYCKSSWKTDVNGYTSYTDCYNRCSSNGRKDTCKTKYSCDDQTSINSYCKNHYLDDGYKSAEMCINDCSCSSSEKALEYIYRPISLGVDSSTNKYKAFPNREAGTNWKGYEAMTIDNTFEESPQYIVELTADAIKEIKKDTNDNKNKYIDYDGDNSCGYYYKSNFIKDHKDIFIKTGGGC